MPGSLHTGLDEILRTPEEDGLNGVFAHEAVKEPAHLILRPHERALDVR